MPITPETYVRLAQERTGIEAHRKSLRDIYEANGNIELSADLMALLGQSADYHAQLDALCLKLKKYGQHQVEKRRAAV